jgi:hypothetical protein
MVIDYAEQVKARYRARMLRRFVRGARVYCDRALPDGYTPHPDTFARAQDRQP